MIKWLGQVLMVSLVIFAAGGAGLSLWATWPELMQRVSSSTTSAPTSEAFAAFTLLAVVSIGFFALVFGPQETSAD